MTKRDAYIKLFEKHGVKATEGIQLDALCCIADALEAQIQDSDPATMALCRIADALESPAFDQRGTGTYGPARQPIAATKPAAPIPFNRAFVEVVKIVRDGLKEAGVQWGDGPQQDAVSTLLIGALNRGWIGPWERQ